jgi:hypothetical protein
MDGEFERYVNAETAVINTASADLPKQIPMYKIYGKEITAQDVELVQQKLKTATAVSKELNGWIILYLCLSLCKINRAKKCCSKSRNHNNSAFHFIIF